VAETRELPLFPLNAVLFPGGPLPLRVFERRYLDMVRHCMRHDRGFGVVLIVRGREVGVGADTVEIGTEARIVDFDRVDNGLLGIACIGQQRIRVVETRRRPDGLLIGRVEDVPADPPLAATPEFGALADAARRVVTELGQVYERVERRFNDAAWVGFRLAEVLPIAMPDKQELLEMTDPRQRLQALALLIQSKET
jgi:Lon protease-like protein